jgi:hypothetical protein
MSGDQELAITSYRAALDRDPYHFPTQEKLSALLSRLGRFDEALSLWRAVAAANPTDIKRLNKTIEAALAANETTIAGEYAVRTATLKRGSAYHRYPGINWGPPTVPSPEPELSVSKLRHDIEQFCYLEKCAVTSLDLTKLIANHNRVLENLLSRGQMRAPLDEDARNLIGDAYGRIVHIRPTSRIAGSALSTSWDPIQVEHACLDHPQGVVVVDDFLSDAVLESLRLFCLQSTVWLTNRYAHGRLGAFFREGFNCPLLLQIADELRVALPRLIGDRHRLQQMWAFKYVNQPSTPAHADFAAVNVNFWLTPDEANLDQDSGGLLFYDVEAPLDWDFTSINKDGPKITAFLKDKMARATTIPYRANRAIIFRSDIFHVTAPVSFKTEYENRRVNVTMLYGRRESGRNDAG